jgi:hypothetical protein
MPATHDMIAQLVEAAAGAAGAIVRNELDRLTPTLTRS